MPNYFIYTTVCFLCVSSLTLLLHSFMCHGYGKQDFEARNVIVSYLHGLILKAGK
jgi:hypothetical protein